MNNKTSRWSIFVILLIIGLSLRTDPAVALPPLQESPTPTLTPSTPIPPPTSTPTPSPTPTLAPTYTPTATPSPTLTLTPTNTPTSSPTHTSTPIPTHTATPTLIPSPVPTSTPTPSPGVIALLVENGWWIGGGCLLLLLLILGLLLILWAFRRKKPRLAPAPSPPSPPPVPAAPHLKSIGTPGGPRRFDLRPEGVTIGRGSENDLVVTQDFPAWETVSRRHARIYQQAGRWIVEDLNSMNGVYVNGRRTGRNLLRDGWQLGIGGVEFVFRAGTGEA